MISFHTYLFYCIYYSILESELLQGSLQFLSQGCQGLTGISNLCCRSALFLGSSRNTFHFLRYLITLASNAYRFLIDVLGILRYSMELFINEGEQVMSMGIFTDIKAEGISFRSNGDLVMDVVMHELEKKNGQI